MIFALLLSHPLDDIPIPATCHQVVYVESTGWQETKATLGRFERTLDGWMQVGETVSVRLGGKGLGWGDGVFRFNPEVGPIKREGDKRSPAGVFRLLFAFGKASTSPEGCRFPYRQATANDYWVDDTASPLYNTWQHWEATTDQPKPSWKSAESMVTKGPYYNLGIVVGHNTKPITAGHGSAIFLHLWANPDETTTGCTSMSRESMETLLRWLDPKADPMLVQLPRTWSAGSGLGSF